MNRISHQLVPPGGWKFMQGDLLIMGETWNDLVKVVTNHRRSNGINFDNVAEEIEDQIADAHPSIIINGPKSKKNQWV